jgi:hypothetical protein
MYSLWVSIRNILTNYTTSDLVMIYCAMLYRSVLGLDNDTYVTSVYFISSVTYANAILLHLLTLLVTTLLLLTSCLIRHSTYLLLSLICNSTYQHPSLALSLTRVLSLFSLTCSLSRTQLSRNKILASYCLWTLNSTWSYLCTACPRTTHIGIHVWSSASTVSDSSTW